MKSLENLSCPDRAHRSLRAEPPRAAPPPRGRTRPQPGHAGRSRGPQRQLFHRLRFLKEKKSPHISVQLGAPGGARRPASQAPPRTPPRGPSPQIPAPNSASGQRAWGRAAPPLTPFPQRVCTARGSEPGLQPPARPPAWKSRGGN